MGVAVYSVNVFIFSVTAVTLIVESLKGNAIQRSLRVLYHHKNRYKSDHCHVYGLTAGTAVVVRALAFQEMQFCK